MFIYSTYAQTNIVISFQINVLKTKIFYQSFNVNVSWYKQPFSGSHSYACAYMIEIILKIKLSMYVLFFVPSIVW